MQGLGLAPAALLVDGTVTGGQMIKRDTSQPGLSAGTSSNRPGASRLSIDVLGHGTYARRVPGEMDATTDVAARHLQGDNDAATGYAGSWCRVNLADEVRFAGRVAAALVGGQLAMRFVAGQATLRNSRIAGEPQHRASVGAQKLGVAVLQHCEPETDPKGPSILTGQVWLPQQSQSAGAQNAGFGGVLVVQHCSPAPHPGRHRALTGGIRQVFPTTAVPPPSSSALMAVRRDTAPASIRVKSSNRSPLAIPPPGYPWTQPYSEAVAKAMVSQPHIPRHHPEAAAPAIRTPREILLAPVGTRAKDYASSESPFPLSSGIGVGGVGVRPGRSSFIAVGP